jgi:hypothetical protein
MKTPKKTAKKERHGFDDLPGSGIHLSVSFQSATNLGKIKGILALKSQIVQ